MHWRFVLAPLLVGGCGGDQGPSLTTAVAEVVSAGVPGALALVREGDRTRTAAAGLTDIDAGVKLRAGDRFRVGSVTKTFVATFVLQLAAEGRLRIDDPVARWLPGGCRTEIRSTRDGSRQAVVVANAYPLPPTADVALRRAAVTAFCD